MSDDGIGGGDTDGSFSDVDDYKEGTSFNSKGGLGERVGGDFKGLGETGETDLLRGR